MDGGKPLDGGINKRKGEGWMEGWMSRERRSGGTDRRREAVEAGEQPCEV